MPADKKNKGDGTTINPLFSLYEGENDIQKIIESQNNINKVDGINTAEQFYNGSSSTSLKQDADPNQQEAERMNEILKQLNITMNSDRNAYLVSRYLKAFTLYQQCLQNEQMLLNGIQEEEQSVKSSEERLSTELAKCVAMSEQVQRLRKELEEHDQKLNTMEDGANTSGSQNAVLREEKFLLEQELEHIKEETTNMLLPKIKAVQTDIVNLKTDITSSDTIITTHDREVTTLKQQVAVLQGGVQMLRADVEKFQTDAEKAASIPAKFARQSELISQTVLAVGSEVEDKEAAMKKILDSISSLRTQIDTIEQENFELRKKVTGLKEEQEKTEMDNENVARDLRSAKTSYRESQERYLMLQNEVDTISNLVVSQNSELTDLMNRKRAKMKAIVGLENALEITKALEPSLEDRKKMADVELEINKKCIKEIGENISTLNAKVKSLTGTLVMTQKDNTDLQNIMDELERKLTIPMDTLAQLKRENIALKLQTTSLRTSRQAACLTEMRAQNNLKKAENTICMRDSELESLVTERSELEQKLVTLSRMHKTFKIQKNTLSQAVKESKQALIEVKQKVKVLSVESEILKSEAHKKEQTRSRGEFVLQSEQRAVANLVEELGSSKKQLRDIHTDIYMQIRSVRSLQKLISQYEGEILENKAKYLRAIEERNTTGIMLIDKNDELKKAYLRLHALQDRDKEGLVYLNQRLEDIRQLKAHENDLYRERDSVKKYVQTELSKNIIERAELLDELAKTRVENEQTVLEARSVALIMENNKVKTVLDLSPFVPGGKGKKQGASSSTTAATTNNTSDEVTDNNRADSNNNSKSLKKTTNISNYENARIPKKQTLPDKFAQTVKSIGATSLPTLNKLNDEILNSDEPHASWNIVGGEVQSETDLKNSVSKLQRYLGEMRQNLLSKFLLDEELTSLTSELQQKMTEVRERADIVRQTSEIRKDLTSVTRKLMATVSESSMVQATLLRLKDIKQDLEEKVKGAQNNFDRGLPPTEEDEQEWLLMQESELNMKEAKARRERELEELIACSEHAPSMAEPRFESYMSCETGLPRPYGKYRPFMPPKRAVNVIKMAEGLEKAKKENEIEI